MAEHGLFSPFEGEESFSSHNLSNTDPTVIAWDRLS
jgi:hypothetical protein